MTRAGTCAIHVHGFENASVIDPECTQCDPCELESQGLSSAWRVSCLFVGFDFGPHEDIRINNLGNP